MLPSAIIISRIDELESLYLAETDPVKMKLWAKLAAIEAGGWVEECIDVIVKDYIAMKVTKSKPEIESRLDKLWGFKYNTEFKTIWCSMIGCICFDKIESSIPMDCQRLETSLNALKVQRDGIAHTYTKASTAIDAPSKIKSYVISIESGLNQFRTAVMSLPI